VPEIRVDPLTGLRVLAPGDGDHRRDDLFTSHPDALVHETVEGGPEAWRERMRAHAGAACLHVAAEGTDRADLYALDFVPAAVARERERFGAYATRTMGGNLLGDLVQEEVRRRERLVAVDDEAVVFAPYASRAPYQLLLAPRAPRRRFEDDGPLGAALLADVVARLARPLDLWVRTAPRGAEQFCWRIDILPRAETGALERGTGLGICEVSPEDAAAALRG
jgi:UDPglucose--hexose-1-phosphate uridylyltransferase